MRPPWGCSNGIPRVSADAPQISLLLIKISRWRRVGIDRTLFIPEVARTDSVSRGILQLIVDVMIATLHIGSFNSGIAHGPDDLSGGDWVTHRDVPTVCVQNFVEETVLSRIAIRPAVPVPAFSTMPSIGARTA
nr:hypothetical protein [Bradyrhizobium jicamae]